VATGHASVGHSRSVVSTDYYRGQIFGVNPYSIFKERGRRAGERWAESGDGLQRAWRPCFFIESAARRNCRRTADVVVLIWWD
jgi:hypothetical protein